MMNRRQFLKRVSLGLAGVAAGTLFYSVQIEPHWLEIVHRPLPIAGLPTHLIGRRLLQLSDIHVGPQVDNSYIKRSFTRLQALYCEYVVYTGDFISDYDRERIDQLAVVLETAPRGTAGTVAILGNHDYGPTWQSASAAADVAAAVMAAGVPVLRNEIADFDGLQIIGIDDIWGTNATSTDAFRCYDPEGAALALCHNPDGADLPFWRGYQGWILAGHTHGGQARAPFLPPPFVPVNNRRYTAGEIDLFDGRRLYVNRGLGYKLPFRLNVRPEATVFHLERAS